ncbi:hypothetical protein OK18_01365 [Chryseobacterium gallinarum]|uniref:Uncharacterized protein n=1 Tax=Chryseobacterium gallinarum TaxID=1324352 RepID=A0A0G3M0D4_CHRGL|nr:hypothetical protein [Chryseobacterium gallinarum]AKK71468.1 hypothetical protein OK18_01365 [Chryseobacterium gallinarum]
MKTNDLRKFKGLTRNELSNINAGGACSMTVNYYNNGNVVAQVSYSGYTSSLCGINNCGQWRQSMMNAINSNIQSSGGIYPSGNDYTC